MTVSPSSWSFTTDIVQTASAQEVNQTRLKDSIRLDYGNGTYTMTFGLPEFIYDLDSNGFVNAIVKEDQSAVTVFSGVNFAISKSDCSISVLDSNGNPVTKDVVEAFHISDPSRNDWNRFAVNDEQCQISTVNDSNGVVVSTVKTDSNFSFETVYKKMADVDFVKADYIVTNLADGTFDGTVGIFKTTTTFDVSSLRMDAEKFEIEGTAVRQKDSFDVTRKVAAEHVKSKANLADRVIEFEKNNIRLAYDETLAGSYLKDVVIRAIDSKLAAVTRYVDTKPLGVGEQFIIDPTIEIGVILTWTVSTTSATGTTCPSPTGTGFGGITTRLPPSTDELSCIRAVLFWNLTSLPSNVAITNISAESRNTGNQNRNCDVHAIDESIISMSPVDAWNYLHSSPKLLSDSTHCKTNGNTAIISNLESYIQAAIDNGDTVWGLGYTFTNNTRDENNYIFAPSKKESSLSITYTSENPNPPTGLTCSNNGANVDCDWTASAPIGSTANTNNFYVGDQETVPSIVRFNTDGTKAFIVGTDQDTVFEYELSTPYELETMTYTTKFFSVVGNETSPQGLFFKPDGTRMYITGTSSNNVHEYSLSTAWDIDTVSYVQTLDTSANGTIKRALFFNSDGTQLFIGSQQLNRIYEYSLSTAWDISTGSFVQQAATTTVSITEMAISSDGKTLWFSSSGSDVQSRSMSTAWDISTLSTGIDTVAFGFVESSGSNGFTWHPDGDRMYIIGAISDTVWQFELEIPWEINTMGYKTYSSDGSNQITDYYYSVSTNNSTFNAPVSVGGNLTSVSISGLSQGTLHYIRVNATVNNNLNSTSSNHYSITTIDVPNEPTDAIATTISTSQIDLSWTAPSNDGGTAITGYRIFNMTDDSIYVADTGSASTSYSATGLKSGTLHPFKVAAINSAGVGSNSTEFSSYTIPETPSNLSALTISTSEINLSWDSPSGIVVGYKIERENPIGGGFSTINPDTGNTTTSYNSIDLTANTQYNFRVSALNGGGTASTPITAANVTGATAPSLTATGKTDTQIDITWTTPTSATSISGYQIQVSNDDVNFSILENDTISISTTYNHVGLPVGAVRYYKVAAWNSFGLGILSTSASGTTESHVLGGGGGGGGGGGSTPEPSSDLISIILGGDNTRLVLGEIATRTLSLTWNDGNDFQINQIIMAESPLKISFQETPFILTGSSQQSSNGLIKYTIQVPAQLCSDTVTFNCVEEKTYEILVTVYGVREGIEYRQDATMVIDLSNDIDYMTLILFSMVGIAIFGVIKIVKRSPKERHTMHAKKEKKDKKSNSRRFIRKMVAATE